MRFATRLAVTIVLLSFGTLSALRGSAHGQGPCTDCVAVPDSCCEKAPAIQGTSFSPNVLVGTRQGMAFFSWPYCVTIFDLGSPAPPEDTDWASMVRYNGPGNSWNEDSLGTVFGLTLDKYGNIFVTHTSCYWGDLVGQVFNAGPGAVYRIDGTTGAITTFCRLPNYPDGGVQAGENLPGLGNITYDCRHEQFFVTDLEDGRIYRIKPVGVNGPTGTIVEVFDPLVADTGPTNYTQSSTTPGWAPLGERLWGVQWHGDRVYYGVWAEDASAGSSSAANEIRSVGLSLGGAFVPTSDKHELYLPPLGTNIWSMPVSDISFSANGKMLLGERGITAQTQPYPHYARALEYACAGGCWLSANTYMVGDYGTKENCAGGVDYDRFPFTSGVLGRVWASGDAIHLYGSYPDAIYGYQGFRPTGGTNVTSMLIDSDGDVVNGDKTSIGDVEAPGGCPAPTTGSICGSKFLDLNRNGVKDGADTYLSGWTITLNGPGGPYTAVTDAQGEFCFDGLAPGTYTVGEIGQPGWVQTAPSGGTYSVSIVAGQLVLGRDFGNFQCVSGACAMPPPGMIAWWPFNEPTSSTTAADLTHQSPPRNVAQLFGGAAISAAGHTGNAICFGSVLDYARVPNANQLGLSFGAQPFAIDAWINVSTGGGGPRMIVEKRVLLSNGPYRTRGWALYLNGTQLYLELGIGISTQILPGPTVAAGSWQHIAVSVERAPAAGRWYLNGALVPAFNFVPTAGGVQSNADVYMGRSSPLFPMAPFEGCIDDLEIFNGTPTPLPAASVQKLYAAGAIGKCIEYCRLPQVTTICKNDSTVKVCFNICNNAATPQNYHWSIAGVGVSAGCTVPGPTSFSPTGGTVTVLPGTCSAPICVTIKRPAGLTAQNATSCFAVTIVNDATGDCHRCDGTIRADNTCWCVTAGTTGIVSVAELLSPGSLGTPVSWIVFNPCGGTSIPYRVAAVFDSTDHSDPQDLSINGLPPGIPWTGVLALGPDGSGTVSVEVYYTHGYDPAALYELVLAADTDGDGAYEVLGGTLIESAYDPDATTAVPAETLAEGVRLLTAPNPFRRGSSVAFSLPLADDVKLAIFDLSGRLVRSLHRGRLTAGPHRFEWDGRDSHGRDTAGGLYFVRLDADRIHLDAKLVKLR